MMTRMSIRSGRALLHAEVKGTKAARPIVFLHAAVADSRMWLQSMEQVESAATLVAYDRRGFGRTQYEPEDYSSIADLTAILDSIAPEKRAVLVGCSQGGRIALDAALEHSERVAGLILIAPNVPGAPEADYSQETEELLALQTRLQKLGDIHRLNSLKAHLWLDGPSAEEGRVSGETRDLLLEMNSIALMAPPAGTDLDISRVAPAFNRLGQVEVPTLMMWGISTSHTSVQGADWLPRKFAHVTAMNWLERRICPHLTVLQRSPRLCSTFLLN